jgi:hypothetical protein
MIVWRSSAEAHLNSLTGTNVGWNESRIRSPHDTLDPSVEAGVRRFA